MQTRHEIKEFDEGTPFETKEELDEFIIKNNYRIMKRMEEFELGERYVESEIQAEIDEIVKGWKFADDTEENTLRDSKDS